MTRKVLLESSEAKQRRKREVAGGAAAECAAVCCCCPCSMMNLLILAVYKVPRGICKRVWAMSRNRKTSSSRKGLLLVGLGRGDDEFSNTMTTAAEDNEDNEDNNVEEEDAALEKEMWDRFYGHGFFRSQSFVTS